MNLCDDSSNFHSCDEGLEYDMVSHSSLPTNLDFSLDEIRAQLFKLGFTQIPDEKLLQMKHDLDEIISHDESLQGTPRLSKTKDSGDWCVSEDNDADNDASSFATITSVSQSDSSKVKRKICRKKASINDNYASLSDNSSPRTIQKELKNLKPQNPEYFRKVSFPFDPVNDVFNYTGASTDHPDNNQFQDYLPRPASKSGFIKAVQYNNNLDRGWQRHDPVTRYHRYKASWDQKKAPGESPHKELRWAVKSAMMVREIPQPREQRYKGGKVKNNYQTPGENKRSDLRWQVRQEIANPDIYFD